MIVRVISVYVMTQKNLIPAFDTTSLIILSSPPLLAACRRRLEAASQTQTADVGAAGVVAIASARRCRVVTVAAQVVVDVITLTSQMKLVCCVVDAANTELLTPQILEMLRSQVSCRGRLQTVIYLIAKLLSRCSKAEADIECCCSHAVCSCHC